MTLRLRLARLARAFASPELTEIVIRGGLADADPFDRAEAGGRTWQRQEGEAEADFRARVRLLAGSLGARHVVFGGIPPAS